MTYAEELDKVLGEWGNRVADRIKSNLDTTGTTASGRTRESVEVVAENGELTITGRQYFRSVEEGRPSGSVPYKFQDIIRKWMDDKGIAANFGEKEWQKRNAAYLISQKIKEYGSRLYRNGGREDIYTDVINEELPELAQQISVMVAETISKAL